MSKPSDSKGKSRATGVDRRSLFLMGGSAVAAAAIVPLAGGEGPVACFGELGLTGELRYVGHPDRRVAEAQKFGLGPVLGPGGGEKLEGLAAHASLRAVLRAALGRGKAAEGDDAELREAA